MYLKSPLKWAGGKKKLAKYILKEFPDNFNNYYEPFAGGATILFEILSQQLSVGDHVCEHEYFVSDINECLINTFSVIKDNVDELILELKKDKYTNHEEQYYKNRERYNNIKQFEVNSDENFNIEKAALFIYLNKCCFNGIYRENLNGLFNVPFGKMKDPIICDSVLLKNISTICKKQKVYFSYSDYTYIINIIQKNDLVYIDPPYLGRFTNYTPNTFEQTEQLKLKTFIDELSNKGVYVILSNNDIDFISNLYNEPLYKQIKLNTTYSIGGNGSDRFATKNELLIKNF